VRVRERERKRGREREGERAHACTQTHTWKMLDFPGRCVCGCVCRFSGSLCLCVCARVCVCVCWSVQVWHVDICNTTVVSFYSCSRTYSSHSKTVSCPPPPLSSHCALSFTNMFSSSKNMFCFSSSSSSSISSFKIMFFSIKNMGFSFPHLLSSDCVFSLYLLIQDSAHSETCSAHSRTSAPPFPPLSSHCVFHSRTYIDSLSQSG